MRRSKKKVLVSVGVIAVIIIFVILAFYYKSVLDYKQAVDSITIRNVDVSRVSDGTYVGECNVNFIYAKVEVTVHEGEITNIEILEHKNDRGKPAETVTDKIVGEQRIDVDAVSGATNSSIVLKKAVEKALSK